MRSVALVAAALLAASASAQRQTIPAIDGSGNSVVISVDLIAGTTQTISTILAAVVPTTTTTARVPVTPTTSALDEVDPDAVLVPTTTTTRAGVLPVVTTTSRTTTAPRQPGLQTPTTTRLQGVQGAPTTNGPPMSATTYFYNPGDGDWVEGTWANSFVSPQVATVVIPQGTILDFDNYMSSVNGNQAASFSASMAAAGASGADRSARVWGGVAGWAGLVAGAVGAGYAMLM